MAGTLSQKIEFVRHTPLQQLLRRVWMTVRRRVLDRFMRGGVVAPCRGAPPLKLELPRLRSPHGVLERIQDGWRATFLGVSREMKGNIAWAERADDARAQLWRMNLHYFEYLPDLPDADAMALISDWIATVRPRNAVSSKAAWTPYAVSLRISAWLDWWASREASPITPDFVARFAGSLREQADYLLANLETDVRGNHLIKNIRALTECAAALPDVRARTWARVANENLARELRVQVLPDGVHFERSASYHAQVLADLITIAAIRPVDGVSRVLDDATDRMAQALADLTHPDGGPALFNDAGLNMAVPAGACLQAYAILRKREAPQPKRNFAYRAAGYFGARIDRDYLIVKMGPLGPDELMAHAHGDWGSLEWSIDGQRVIVDQGVFEYVEGEKRAAARSTTSHNTAMVDETEQAELFGSFRCGARPRPSPPRYEETAMGFVVEGELAPMEHSRRVRQRRRLALSGRNLKIDDEALAGGVRLTTRLLLHPDVTCLDEERSLKLAHAGGLRIAVSTNADALAVERAVWWPEMGREDRTLAISATAARGLKTEVSVEP